MKQCKWCGANFVPTVPHQRYCPYKDCAEKAQRAKSREWKKKNIPALLPREVKCAECGQTFTAMHSMTKYCSEGCRKKVQVRVARERRARAKRLRVCAYCGGRFKGRGRQKYCSDECRRLAYNQRVNARWHRLHPEAGYYRHTGQNSITDLYGFIAWYSRKWFPFLWEYHREDAVQEARIITWQCEQLGLTTTQAVGRFAQRELYRLARNLGWARLRNGGWEKR